MERQHQVSHLNKNPDFDPQDPVIHINVLNVAEGETGVEWDVQACKSFSEDYGRWSKLRPNESIPT